MIDVLFGKRGGTASVTTNPLAQVVVPAFLVVGLAAAFGNGMVLSRGHNQRIDIEFIGENRTIAVGIRDSLPKFTSGGFGPIANDKGYDLTGAPTLGGP